MKWTDDDKKSKAHYSRICTEECGGACCDPWWGIISYPLVKPDGAANLDAWRKVLLGSITERALRISRAYVTKEAQPKRLFCSPERYNVKVQEIAVEGNALVLTLLAMFSFRCRYIGKSNECTIHPSLTIDTERDIRPDQCGFLGVPGAGPGESGHCRIIYEAGTDATLENEAKIAQAVKREREVSLNHQQSGVATAEEAADRILAEVRRYVKLHPGLQADTTAKPGVKTGRNEPCVCGSGKKFKKCCGK